MISTRAHQCRVCKSKKLIPVLDLGDLAVSDFVTSTLPVAQYPLNLVLCDPKQGCGLLQLGNMAIDQDLLYRQYWYKSGINKSMQRALKQVARNCQRKITLKDRDIVVDIGANDGTLLSFFPQWLTRVGIEPALNLQSDLQVNTSVNVPEYFSKKAYTKYVGERPAKLITSLAMFYDLDDPVSFVIDLQKCLAPDGMWVNQMTYLGTMLQKSDYPNICHEHVTYFSLHTFLEVLKRTSLKLIDVTQNDVNGGSIRTTVAHVDGPLKSSKPAAARIQAVLESEATLGLHKTSVYEQFAKRARENKRSLRTLIKSFRDDKKSIYVYGASTKGNTLLQYCGLTHNEIDGAFDRNPAKNGLLTVATHIPIYPESEMSRLHPDVLLVLPWHFKEEFLRQEKKFLQNGGTMIFPLPELEIVDGR